MKKVFFVIKIVLFLLFFVYISLIFGFALFMPAQKRFDAAEHSQGLLISQMMFDILIFQNRNYSDAYFEKSVAHNKRGDYAKGFELLNKAVDIDPEIHLGYRGWLRLVKLKDYRGCIEDLKRLDALTPNTVDYAWGENTHYLLGLSYKGLREYGLALREFDMYLKSEKDIKWVNPNMFLYKAIILKDMNNFSDAMHNLNMCLENNEHSSEAYYYKGLIYKKLYRVDSAKLFFEKSLALYQTGYKNGDVYNEVPNQLYLSDIEQQLNTF